MGKREKPELLSPAGSMQHLTAAVENGADAVYFGAKKMNARAGAQNFSPEEIARGVEYAHDRGVRAYLTMNTLLKEGEVEQALDLAEQCCSFGVDAFILQDLGLADKMRKRIPGAVLHLSTQGTVYNLEGAVFAKGIGFSRVILARELSEKQIKEIADQSGVETEVFVHGALCVCTSGQCKMSLVRGGRSGNRGDCAQPCRQVYRLFAGGEELGMGYLLSPKDLCLMSNIHRMMHCGVTSIKIEGRLKSPEYTALTARAYREAIDRAFVSLRDEEAEKKMRADLERVFHRGFMEGYFSGMRNASLLSGAAPKHQGTEMGRVEKVRLCKRDGKKKQVLLRLREDLRVGDGVEFRKSEKRDGGVITFLFGERGICREAARGERVWIGDLTGRPSKGDSLYRTTDTALLERIRKTYEGRERENGGKARTGCEAENSGKARTGRGPEKSGKAMTGYEAGSGGKTENRSTNREVRSDRSADKKISVFGVFTVTREGAEFTVRDEYGRKGAAKAGRDIWGQEERGELTAERIQKQLSKCGNTPYSMASCEIKMQASAGMPVSVLNALRRGALEALDSERLREDNEDAGNG